MADLACQAEEIVREILRYDAQVCVFEYDGAAFAAEL